MRELGITPQSTHSVAIAIFWRTFHNTVMEKKLAQPGESGGRYIYLHVQSCGVRLG